MTIESDTICYDKNTDIHVAVLYLEKQSYESDALNV